MKRAKIFSLVKGNISLLASLSAVAGFVLQAGKQSLSPSLAGVFLGTLTIAMGASVLNQYQERDIDSRMERTRQRAIPAGEITPKAALAVALALALSGTMILLTAGGTLAAGLGAFALFWYNGVYTYLKRVTAFAVIPGALVGSIPPAIGWAAAGGTLGDPRIVILSSFFFIWQVPHFWLLAIRYSDDYQRAGLKTPADRLNKRQLPRITFIWLMATAVTSLSLPLFQITGSRITGALLTAAALLYMVRGIFILGRKKGDFPTSALFQATNLFALLVILLVSLGGIL